MDAERPDEERGAKILTLPVSGNTPVERDDHRGELEPSDTSFEVVLDDGPAPVAPTVTPPGSELVVRRIIPEHLSTWAGVKSTITRKMRLAAHRVAHHGVRCPSYLFWALWWGFVGVFRGGLRQVRWWWLCEATALRHHHVDKKDGDAWHKLHREIKASRLTRGRWLLAELVTIIVGVALMWWLAPWWAWLILGAVATPLLARIGRPKDKPIVSAAVIQPRFRVITADAVLRAYYAAGLGDPGKPDQMITFEGLMSRDARDVGSQVQVVLPYGRTHSQAIAVLEKIASGLDVALTQVYLKRDKSSNRRHLLWIADVDPLSIPAGRTPLLDRKPRDIWAGVPFGLDEKNQKVVLPLIFQSILVASQPRKGKTFSARLIGLFAALDPYVRISLFDGKGSPDWRSFALVAYTCGFGLLPNRAQGDPIQNLLATLRAAKKDILERNIKLSDLPTSICPEGKLTRDISRNPKYKMPVWLIILDEFQEYLKTGDETIDTEIADLLVFIVRVGPSVGVIIISSTQRPVGLGSSNKVGKLFADYRDNHLTRFALKTGSPKVSDYILGEGAHAEGFDSSKLPVGGEGEFKGIGILYDAEVDNCTVRTYLADGEDAKKILGAAREHRQRAGTLDGMAVGEAVAVQPRDPLADTLDVFWGDETAVSWGELAERLAEQMPEQYAQITGEALSSTIRGLGLGVESSSVRVAPSESVPSGVTTGPKRAALSRALQRRGREESRT